MRGTRRSTGALALAWMLTAAPRVVSADDQTPLAVLTPVSVVATRAATPLADPSAAVSDVGGDEVRRSAARTVDDLLRRIPGFSLFRRLGSGAAHPTAQGVSLRGLGPSGTSRALVLVDGVPLNDPFGGWVYWNSIPSETIDRIEVLRGSGASLWGNFAMGGVIGVVTRMPVDGEGGLVAEGGERGGARTEGWVARRFGATSALVDARWMRSGDYPLVRDDRRGTVDVPGGSEHGSGGLRVEHDLSDAARLRLVLRGFHEDRDNGTAYTGNETTRGFLRAGLDVDTGDRGRLAADVFGSVQEFSSTFSSVNADRSGETPASDQFDVPSSSAGGSLVWTRAPGEAVQGKASHRVVAGLDALWVEGRSEEYARYLDGAFTRRRNGGATQAMFGVFGEDLVALSPSFDATLALRLDHWQSYDGFRREVDTTSGSALVQRGLPGRGATLVSPRVGVAWRVLDEVALRSAVYRGFRAPTVNEQVRPFRVRNDITEANADLEPEKLFGVEGGYDGNRGPWRSSATLYWNEIDDPVFNVTVGGGGGVVEPCGFVPAGGVCRQRRNLGRSSVLGVEAGVGVDLGYGLSASVAYLWADATIRSAKDDPTLEGNRLPQVPRHQGTVALDYDDGGPWRASVQVRAVGRQFDDDANTRRLSAFAAVDAFVARKLGRGFEAFVAAENLFDKTVESGLSADGVVSIGAPRLVRAGVRYTFGADSR